MTNFSKIKIVILLLALMILLLGCSNQELKQFEVSKGLLNAKVSLPEYIFIQEALTPQITSIEIIVKNQTDSSDKYIKSKAISSITDLEFSFSNLKVGSNYDIEVKIKDDNYVVYQGKDFVAIKANIINQATVLMSLNTAENLVINLTNLPSAVDSGQIDILPLDENLNTAINYVTHNHWLAKFGEIPARIYDLEISFYDNNKTIVGESKLIRVKVKPGRPNATINIDWANLVTGSQISTVIPNLSKVTNIVINEGPTGINLSWDSISSAVSYEIYRSSSKTGDKEYLIETVDTSYLDKNIVGAKTYWYWVVAKDENKNIGPFSEGTSITTDDSFQVNNNTITFTTADKLYLTDLSGNLKEVSTYNHPHNLIWSPNKSRLAYNAQYDTDDILAVIDSDGNNYLSLVDMSQVNREGQLTANQPGEFFYSNRWSPQGDKMAYILHSSFDSTTGTSQLYVEDLNHNDIALTEDVNWIADEFYWFPDGSKLLYTKLSHDSNGKRIAGEIHVVNADGSNDTIVFQSPAGSNEIPIKAALSPDGNTIAFAGVNTQGDDHVGNDLIYIYSIGVDGNQDSLKTIVGDFGKKIKKLKWSPDGNKIAYQLWNYSTSDGGLYCIAKDGSNKIVLALDSAKSFYWSPDSSKVAYRSDEVYIIDADGSNQKQLTTGSGFVDYDWHQTNNQLIYGTDKLYLYDADTAQISVIKEIVDEYDITHMISRLDW